MSADDLGFYPMPLGAVLAFAGNTDAAVQDKLQAAGWLLCDGRAVSRARYEGLYRVMGSIHGSGDGVTSFHLPDYRGRFLRGTDGGAGRDPDAAARTAPAGGGQGGDAVGSVQADEFRAHQHSVNEMVHDDSVDGVDSAVRNSFEHRNQLRATGEKGGRETRPVNAAVQWLILAGTPIDPAPTPAPAPAPSP